jgi:hypothetical protein
MTRAFEGAIDCVQSIVVSGEYTPQSRVLTVTELSRPSAHSATSVD